VKLGGDRTITERLLFVTNRDKLCANVGEKEAISALKLITDDGQRLLELPAGTDKIDAAINLVRTELNSAKDKYAGVVIVGGYDVVPAARLDVLDAKLRATLNGLAQIGNDSDEFLVWSDALYGDFDGDTVGEIPVSRIPDGRSPELVLNALQSPASKRGSRGGVFNIQRPFAKDVYNSISGKPVPNLISCGPDSLFNFAPPVGVTEDVYFMLHGSDNDASRFWGEDGTGGIIEAVDVADVPAQAAGAIVFAGCCWGALTVTPRASKVLGGKPIRPRLPESSIALAYLKAGALAFVGCTGTHYSPVNATPPAGLDFFGKPMHVAFWANINAGKQPAQALFDAKMKFGQGMPHGPDDPFSRAVEMKILREFTVLGLGW
jgi:hypothetical protein